MFAVFGWLGGDHLTGDEHNAIYFLEDSLRDYIANFHYGTFLKIQFWILHELFGNSFLWYRMPAALSAGAFLAWLAFYRVAGLPRSAIGQALVVLFIAGNARFLFFARWGMPNYGESILVVALFLGSVVRDVAQGRFPNWTPWRIAGMAALPWIYPATTILLGAISSTLLLAALAGALWRQDLVRQAGGFLRIAARSSVPLVLGAVSLGLYRLSRADAHWERARGHHKSFTYWLEQGNDGVMPFVADSLGGIGADLVQLAPVSGSAADVLARAYPLLGLALGLCMVAALALVAARAWRRRGSLPEAERSFLFAGAFLSTCVTTCLAVTNLAALLDAFPIGSLRHQFFLIPALGLLAVLSFAYLSSLLAIRPRTFILGPWIGTTTCVAFGALLATGLAHERQLSAARQEALMAILEAPGNDITVAFEPGFYLSEAMLPSGTRYFAAGVRSGMPEDLLAAMKEVAARPTGGTMAFLTSVKLFNQRKSPVKRFIDDFGLLQEGTARSGRLVALRLHIPDSVALPVREVSLTVALPTQAIRSVRIDPSPSRYASVNIDSLVLSGAGRTRAIDPCADSKLELMRASRVDAQGDACRFVFGNRRNTGWFAASRLRDLPPTAGPRSLHIRMKGDLKDEVRVYLDLGQGYKTPIRVRID